MKSYNCKINWNFLKKNWRVCIIYHSWLIFAIALFFVCLIWCCDNVKDGLSAGAALLGIVMGYGKFQADRKLKTLSEYNRRYSSDEVINRVVKYIIYNMNSNENHSEGTATENQSVEEPSEHDIEMFYRFFEEIELAIERGILKSKDVYNLFAYYALAGIEENYLRLEGYRSSWVLLRRFIYRMLPLYRAANKRNSKIK